jgi:hypothetical protein
VRPICSWREPTPNHVWNATIGAERSTTASRRSPDSSRNRRTRIDRPITASASSVHDDDISR